MSGVLDNILANKRREIKTLKVPDRERTKPVLDFRQAILDRHFICEVKKASPSLGAINQGADPVQVAKMYESLGAACVSVLTDRDFFSGSFADLRDVAGNVGIPVLCKDFIISEKQIDMAYLMGADAVLLMATSLSREDYERLYGYVLELGMQALVEIHEVPELDVVRGMNPAVLGVNSRNLKTLEIDINKGADIIKNLPDSYVKVAESGMKTGEDVRLMRAAGAEGFLVGSSLMGAGDPKAVFESLKAGL